MFGIKIAQSCFTLLENEEFLHIIFFYFPYIKIPRSIKTTKFILKFRIIPNLFHLFIPKLLLVQKL